MFSSFFAFFVKRMRSPSGIRKTEERSAHTLYWANCERCSEITEFRVVYSINAFRTYIDIHTSVTQSSLNHSSVRFEVVFFLQIHIRIMHYYDQTKIHSQRKETSYIGLFNDFTNPFDQLFNFHTCCIFGTVSLIHSMLCVFTPQRVVGISHMREWLAELPQTCTIFTNATFAQNLVTR